MMKAVAVTSEMQESCKICGNGLLVALPRVYDTRFGIPGDYSIGLCNECRNEQTVPAPSSSALKDLYEKYYNFKGTQRNLYTKVRAKFLSSVFYRLWMWIDGDISFHNMKGKGKLLDVGCNEGRGLQIYTANGFTAEGLELNEIAAAEARAAGFTVYTDLLENFQPQQRYDVVVLSNVLEHSLDPHSMLAKIENLLTPGGEVWISCPNRRSWFRSLFGPFWINWHVPFHIMHFSSDGLEKVLSQRGFAIKSLRHRTPALWLAQSIIARVFARKGVSTHQLRSPFLVFGLMSVLRLLFFPLLSLENLMGRGDCLVVVAQKVK